MKGIVCVPLTHTYIAIHICGQFDFSRFGKCHLDGIEISMWLIVRTFWRCSKKETSFRNFFFFKTIFDASAIGLSLLGEENNMDLYSTSTFLVLCVKKKIIEYLSFQDTVVVLLKKTHKHNKWSL